MAETNAVIAFRDACRINNFPLMDTATWISNVGTQFPTSTLIDVQLVVFGTAMVGLRQISVVSGVLYVTFEDPTGTYSVTGKSYSTSTPEMEISLYDKIGRTMGLAVMDSSLVNFIVNSTASEHLFDVATHAVVPYRVARVDASVENLLEVDGTKFFGQVTLVGEGTVSLLNGGVAVIGNPYVNMTDAKWITRHRALTQLNNITGSTAQSAVITGNYDGKQDLLRVSVRDGALHFSLAGLE